MDVATISADDRPLVESPKDHPLEQIISGYHVRNAETQAVQDDDFGALARQYGRVEVVGLRAMGGFLHRSRRHLDRIEQMMGGLLVVTGVLFITGSMNEIDFWLLETFPTLGRIG